MKRFNYIFLLLLCFSCKKDSLSGEEVTYKARAAFGVFDRIFYLDANGDHQLTEGGPNWSVSFINSAPKPRVLYFDVRSDEVSGYPVPLTLEILIDGVIVKNGTSHTAGSLHYDWN